MKDETNLTIKDWSDLIVDAKEEKAIEDMATIAQRLLNTMIIKDVKISNFIREITMKGF